MNSAKRKAGSRPLVMLAVADLYSLFHVQSVLKFQGFDTVTTRSNLDIMMRAQRTRPVLIVVELDFAAVELPDLLPMLRCYPTLKTVPVIAFTSKTEVPKWQSMIKDELCQVSASGQINQRLLNLAGLLNYFRGMTTRTGEDQRA